MLKCFLALRLDVPSRPVGHSRKTPPISLTLLLPQMPESLTLRMFGMFCSRPGILNESPLTGQHGPQVKAACITQWRGIWSDPWAGWEGSSAMD